MLVGGSLYNGIGRLWSASRSGRARSTLRLRASSVGDSTTVLRGAEYRAHCYSRGQAYGPLGGVVACSALVDRRIVVPRSPVSGYSVGIMQVKRRTISWRCGTGMSYGASLFAAC